MIFTLFTAEKNSFVRRESKATGHFQTRKQPSQRRVTRKARRLEGPVWHFVNEIFNDVIVASRAVVRNSPLCSGSLNDAKPLCDVAARALTLAGPWGLAQLRQFSCAHLCFAAGTLVGCHAQLPTVPSPRTMASRSARLGARRPARPLC